MKTPRRGSKRASEPPTAETIEIHTSDGVQLRADVREPARGSLRGVAVLAHAMFARRVQFERPRGAGLARFLVERGWRTIAFDFRGHGESGVPAGQGGAWTYDDLVMRDVPAVVASARARAKRLPVIVVGHSLGAHVSLAAQAIGAIEADALVGFASNVWLAALEPSRARWLAKRGIMTIIRAVCEQRGYFPARALKLGSDDESKGYFRAFERFSRTGVWGSDDAAHDYLARLPEVKIPLLQIASEGDRWNCHPDCAERFVAGVGGAVTHERIERADDGGPPPDHMQLITSARVMSVWERAATWMSKIERAPRKRSIS